MRKSTKYTIVAVALILGGLYVGAVYVLPALTSAGVAPPSGAGLFRVDGMVGVSTGLTNTATITEVDAASGTQVDWYDTAADWATTIGGDDFAVEADITNLNTGSTTVIYVAQYSIASVGMVTDQNAGTSFSLINKDANGFWDVTYTQGSGMGAFSQSHDKASEAFGAQDVDAGLDVDAVINAGAFNAMTAGQSYSVSYSIAGTTCILVFHAQ